ncbi:hypothetical protein ANCDUO_25761 [Ancylostoma duodenale]|uniref:Uncharacterized protein n=1 Tax=Ancylostoma duodenale TaxID=51022 RepID=A0A0C2F6R1_9BILA|nr:hypothetical protein ANCDUO_25761 [Ancylostoma duodenale]
MDLRKRTGTCCLHNIKQMLKAKLQSSRRSRGPMSPIRHLSHGETRSVATTSG